MAAFKVNPLFVSVIRYLKNVSIEGDQGKPNVNFTPDGVLKAAQLKIMNLRPGVSKQHVWEEVSAEVACVSHAHPEPRSRAAEVAVLHMQRNPVMSASKISRFGRNR